MRPVLLAPALLIGACLPRAEGPQPDTFRVETDTDTDTDADTDTDTDTDTDGPTLSRVSPNYGTNTGGYVVSVLGNRLDQVDTVTFNGAQAEIENRDDGMIDVIVPATTATGAVSVGLQSPAGDVSAAGAFLYFAEGEGLVGVIGAVTWAEFLGDYWSPEPPDVGEAWFALIQPIDATWPEIFASPSRDTCTSEYSYAGSISVLDPGAELAELKVQDTIIELAGANGLYEVALGEDQYFAQARHDLLALDSPNLPTFRIDDIAQTPARPTLSRPNLDTTAIPYFERSDLVFEWTATGADYVLLSLQLYDDFGNSVEKVTCHVSNDGSFSVPTSVWNSWRAGLIGYALLGAARESSGELPLNNAMADVPGIYYLGGAFITD